MILSARNYFLLLFILLSSKAMAQNCALSLEGKVYDADTKSVLPFATLYVQELKTGTEANEQGVYKFNSLCKRQYKIVCAFVGYKTDTLTVNVTKNTTINFLLHSNSQQVQEVIVQGNRGQEKPLASLTQNELKGEELEQVRGTTLGESLKNITGVYVLQTGPSIFKPVIHGLHSNNILIFNNGVRLEGQQWGSEHAPEVDPFIATKITVVKGANSIRYGSDAVGGIIKVDPAPLPTSHGVTGEFNDVFASNNRMEVASGILQGTFGEKILGLSWRTQGTYRRAGNSRTPKYFLENTGLEEANFSGAVGYQHKNFGGEVFYSQFNTKLGIFTGAANAESIADLSAAINRSEPITPSYFSYKIDRPYQQVNHGLFKVNAFYIFKNLSRLDIVFARQQNVRREYDFQPLNVTDPNQPQLYLRLITHTVDVIYKHRDVGNYSGSLGFNGITQGNVREFQMLIPNFRNYGGGLFYIGKWTKDKLTLEGGTRFDYRWLRVYTVDNNTAQVITPTWNWQNATGMIGSQYYFKQNLSWLVNLGTAWRAPTVNELMSNGVHQSAVSYEVGNQNLHTEHAYNLNTSLHYHGKKLHAELGLYDNIINGYIYLKPTGNFIHTIRGAYLEFDYTQVDARFRGIDLSADYFITDSLSFSSKMSLMYAWNKTINNWLQLVPANRYESSVRYGIGDKMGLKQIYMSISGIYTVQQTRVPPQPPVNDFMNPPAGYFLLSANVGFIIPVGKTKLQLNMTGANLLNTAYRDYMDRFRYFNDEPGRNFTIRVRVPIGISH